mmetsp:Transcript_17368/g.43660  ORF Transcript_17368/g.43660 Transcript_17368/m.43660 type:complete len:596 (-) Transcript_17368:499-2286(-)
MCVHLVWCETTYCRGHASNLMASRSFFSGTDPILVVMSDHLFEDGLLERLADLDLLNRDCADAVALVDDTQESINWVSEDHCDAFCKNGHCQKIVKVMKGTANRLVRIGKRLSAYDGLEAGAYLIRPIVFDVLVKLLAKTVYCTLADAMQKIADSGKLRYVSTQGFQWYSELTVSSLQQPEFVSKAVWPRWRTHAKAILAESAGSPSFSRLEAPADDVGMRRVGTFIQLGEAIGEGASSVVCEAVEHSSGDSLPDGQSMIAHGADEARVCSGGNLAVKMVKHSDYEHEQLAMWETHVLQQLNHKNISKLRDMIDLVDATYIVMERVDGPELGDYIAMQNEGRLHHVVACRVFSQLLAALRHAHKSGFLHCDIKPANIRLTYDFKEAVLTDWGFSRQVGSAPCNASMFGTPAYAPPEQLTGYCPDGISGGTRKLCAAADVWALGATLHEMLTGYTPFKGDTFDQLVRNVINLNYSASFADDVPREARDVVLGMLQVNPCDRLTINELISCDWVTRFGVLEREARPEEDLDKKFADDDPKLHGRGMWRMRLYNTLSVWRGTMLKLLYASIIVGAILLHCSADSRTSSDVFQTYDHET